MRGMLWFKLLTPIFAVGFGAGSCKQSGFGPAGEILDRHPDQANPASTDDAAHWFPFTLEGLDSTPNDVDLSYLNPSPAGADGFIGIRDGHFVDGTGRRVRFFGTNLTATPCFPEKQLAPRIAAHLKKLGMNVVRFHFLDSSTAPNGILQADRKTIDPAQLDKLDFFIAELQKAGIYANLNLHVARRYPGLDEASTKPFWFGKTLDRFHPPFIEAQKDYAKQLLTHKNPYTGKSYAADPGVLCIELNNENTIFPFFGGDIDKTPEPYRTELARQWHAWLKQRYKNTAGLRAAWTSANKLGRLVIPERELETRNPDWVGQASAAPGQLEHVARDKLLRYSAERAGGESWHLQFYRTKLPVKDGEVYTLSFEARAASAGQVLIVTAMLDMPDWRNVGLNETLTLEPKWTRHKLVFRAKGAVAQKNRLNFSLNNEPGQVELRKLSLREGIDSESAGVAAGQTLENGKLTLPSARQPPVSRRGRDFRQFLHETELSTSKTLMSYLENELEVKSLVVDSQINFGGIPSVLREIAQSDFIDVHGYWQHPSFPGGSWNSKNWTISNVSQVEADQGGVLAEMAAHRIAGRPLSVSEYNVPAPNDHVAETYPMLAAIAAFQDWDALYPYTYLDFKSEWQADKILGFFDLNGQPARLVFTPGATLAFRRGLVRPSSNEITLHLPREGLLENDEIDSLPGLWRSLGVSLRAVSAAKLEVAMQNGGGAASTSRKFETIDRVDSDTGELGWTAKGEQAMFRVNAPSVRIAIGRLSGQRIELGDLSVEIGPRENAYACMQIVALDEKPLAASKRLLIAVAARVENRNMGWNAGRTSIGDQWGDGPTQAELVPVTLELPGAGWKMHALDGKGARGAELPASGEGDKTRFSAGTNHASLWYLASR